MMNISSNTIKNYAGGGFSLSGTLKCVAIALAVSIVLLFIFSFIIAFTPYPEGMVKLGIILILVVSNLTGGWLTAKEAQSRGWLNGTVAGAFYMLLLFIIGSFINGFNITSSAMLMILFGLLSGAVGGIFGINTKRKTR